MGSTQDFGEIKGSKYSSFAQLRVFLRVGNSNLLIADMVTVATTRMAPPTLVLQLNFSSFTDKKLPFCARKLMFWVFPIDFILIKMVIDII